MAITSLIECQLMQTNKNPNDMYRRYPADTKTFTDFVIKNETDIINPIIEINTATNDGGAWFDMRFNYCILKFWNPTKSNWYYRDYWITKFEFPNRNTVRYYLHEDVLATFAVQIKDSTQWISRSYSKCNPDLNDPLAIISGVPYETQYTSVTSPLDSSFGFYVCGFTGCDKGTNAGDCFFSTGSVNYFAVTPSSMKTLIEDLMHLQGNLADQNPISRIISVMYIPVWGSGSGVSTQVKFYFNDSQGQQSDYPINLTVRHISNNKAVITATTQFVNLPNHPDFSNTNRRYLALPPYTTHIFRAGPFGDIELDNTLMSPWNVNTGVQQFPFTLELDLVSGQGRLIVGAGEGFRHEIAQVGVPIPVTQIVSNSLYAVQSIKNQLKSDMSSVLMAEYATLQNAGSSALGNVLNPSKTSIAGNTINAFSDVGMYVMQRQTENLVKDKAGLSLYQASLPEVTTNGASGSFLGINESWFVRSTFQKVVFPDYTKFGYPCYESAKISTLSGYVKCDTALFMGTAWNGENIYPTLEERQMINEYMINGFYYNP